MADPARSVPGRVPEGSITGWLAGDGSPVLVLHDGPGLSDYTAPLAAELEDAFRVTLCQQRGLAPSTASGAVQHRLARGGVGRAHVIGHSWAVT